MPANYFCSSKYYRFAQSQAWNFVVSSVLHHRLPNWDWTRVSQINRFLANAQMSENVEFDDCVSCFSTSISTDNCSRKRRSRGRSFQGCITCRRRHVRCDEKKPVCQRCAKRGIHCEGYALFRPQNRPALKKNKCEISAPAPQALVRVEDVYTSQFLSSVASILIVYDSGYNKNPFRSILPTLATQDNSLYLSMQALGALHLARTNFHQDFTDLALVQYNTAVIQLRRELPQATSLQEKMACLASSLLLCFYEVTDADVRFWRTHLRGAREIFEKVVHEKPSNKKNQALNFLISLFAYLDVSAAVATGEGTLVQGNYWEMYGAGWDFNLGLNDDEKEPAGLRIFRTEFSKLMYIMGKLSLLHSTRDPLRSREVRQQLQKWHADFPLHILQKIARQRQEAVHCTPDTDVSREELSFRESAMATFCYGQACTVHLFRVTSNDYPPPPHVLLAIERVLDAIRAVPRHSSATIMHIGMLWAVFTVALELAEPRPQHMVREYLGRLQRFGLGNIDNAIEFLEDVWGRRCRDPSYVVDIVWEGRRRGAYMLLP